MKWTRDKVRDEVIEILRPHAQGDVALTEQSQLVADLGSTRSA